jgi:hypothetical protein
MKLQAEFQKKLAEAQAKGDFTAIGALSTGLQNAIQELSQRLTASFSAPGDMSALLGETSSSEEEEDEEIDDEEAIPKDDECIQLMLLGAMYVEENNTLERMVKNNSEEEFAVQLKEILAACFSALDMNMTGIVPEEIQDVLAESWDVSSKDDLTNRLAWLLKEGHHKEIKQLISYAKTNPSPESRTLADFRARFDEPLAFKDETEEEFRDALVLAENMAPKLSPAGIRGWDVARYVQVLRLGYMAGFIGSDECWVYLRRLKEPAAKTFIDWKDFAHSYMMGFRWWSGTSGPIDDACKRLLEHPKSPWRVFGWFS